MTDVNDETPVLRHPAEGVPDVVDTPDALMAVADAMTRGSGPVAVDAERASGHRYGQSAYLIQLRREGSGTHLVDPAALGRLDALADAINPTEWILHAATQDLPCLAEVGLRPESLFDTELAARILGLPRVGLASLTEDLLGVSLAKGHGAADWSRRPLPESWIIYAALDVELLHELREDLIERLHRAGRTRWAEEEFAYLTTWQPKADPEPWRRTSGVAKLRDPRDLAVVRELWLLRDQMARAADQPVGRILKDSVVIQIVTTKPPDQEALAALPAMNPQRRRIRRWWDAVERARSLPDYALPQRVAPDGPPPQRSWERRDPDAAARLTAVRSAISEHAATLGMPPEVLVSPDPVRALIWNAEGRPLTPDDIATGLSASGVRGWQIEQVAPVISAALDPTRP